MTPVFPSIVNLYAILTTSSSMHGQRGLRCSNALRMLAIPLLVVIVCIGGANALRFADGGASNHQSPLLFALAIGGVQVVIICDLHARQLLCQPFR